MVETKLYAKRWLMLAIFCSYSASNAFQWNEYATITDILTDFYGVSALTLDWMAMCYMVAYIVLVLPVNWLLDKYGLLNMAVLASGLNALGCWIKVPSANPDKLWLSLVGQCIVAVSNVCLLGIPPQLAATWFGKNEVSKATAIGVLGNELGIALGFILPPIFVPSSDQDDKQLVAKYVKLMFYSTAIVTTIQFLLVVIFFQEKPPSPPSEAQAAAEFDDIRQSTGVTLKELATHQ